MSYTVHLAPRASHVATLPPPKLSGGSLCRVLWLGFATHTLVRPDPVLLSGCCSPLGGGGERLWTPGPRAALAPGSSPFCRWTWPPRRTCGSTPPRSPGPGGPPPPVSPSPCGLGTATGPRPSHRGGSPDPSSRGSGRTSGCSGPPGLGAEEGVRRGERQPVARAVTRAGQALAVLLPGLIMLVEGLELHGRDSFPLLTPTH